MNSEIYNQRKWHRSISRSTIHRLTVLEQLNKFFPERCQVISEVSTTKVSTTIEQDDVSATLIQKEKESERADDSETKPVQSEATAITEMKPDSVKEKQRKKVFVSLVLTINKIFPELHQIVEASVTEQISEGLVAEENERASPSAEPVKVRFERIRVGF